MILTDIIEFYKCLKKNLSGAAASLKERKRKEKEEVVGGNNHSPKYSGGRKMFEKLLWERIKALVLRLPAASARLHSLLQHLSPKRSKKKKKNSLEVRRWGRGPSLPSELRSHLEKTSASLINLSSASPGGRPLAPHTHTSSSTLARRTWRNARCTESLRCVYRPTCHFAICRSLSP